MGLTIEQYKKSENIPTFEIEMDIDETQIEINELQKELNALKGERQSNRLMIYITKVKIKQRKSFIGNLTSILEYRKSLVIGG